MATAPEGEPGPSDAVGPTKDHEASSAALHGSAAPRQALTLDDLHAAYEAGRADPLPAVVEERAQQIVNDSASAYRRWTQAEAMSKGPNWTALLGLDDES